jgi:hypothetical protein
MKDLMKNWSQYLLTESSLSRIYQHITEHDTALLTAFRDDASDLSSCSGAAVDAELSNKERNRNLKATLLSLGYGVTAVDGSFIENYGNLDKQVEVKEDSFFVVNLNDSPDFIESITNLGRPMVFKEGQGEYKLDIYENYSRNSRMVMRVIAKRILGKN